MMRRSCFGLLFLEARGVFGKWMGNGGFKSLGDAGVWLEFLDD